MLFRSVAASNPTPIEVKVAAAEVVIPAPVVNVAAPNPTPVEIHNDVAVPSVEVKNTIEAAAPLPANPAPIVNVTVSPTPVTVENTVPVPLVNVQNTIEAPSGELTAEFTPQGALKSLKRGKKK